MDTPRFYTPADVADILNTTVAQVMALIRDGELISIQIGGRRQHRIEADQLEDYIARMYARARADRAAGAVAPLDAPAAN